jgi:hypothetical protein
MKSGSVDGKAERRAPSRLSGAVMGTGRARPPRVSWLLYSLLKDTEEMASRSPGSLTLGTWLSSVDAGRKDV